MLTRAEYVAVLERRRKLGRQDVDSGEQEVARRRDQGRELVQEEKQVVARRLGREMAM